MNINKVFFHQCIWNFTGKIEIFSITTASQLDEEGVFVKEFQYSPLIGGFAIVLSNGRSAFMTANTLKFDPAVSISFNWIRVIQYRQNTNIFFIIILFAVKKFNIIFVTASGRSLGAGSQTRHMCCGQPQIYAPSIRPGEVSLFARKIKSQLKLHYINLSKQIFRGFKAKFTANETKAISLRKLASYPFPNEIRFCLVSSQCVRALKVHRSTN